MRLVIYISVIIIFMSCSGSPVPDGILVPDKMEKVVTDLMKVDEYLNTFSVKDTTGSIKVKRSIFYGQVFKMHGINRKQFYTSYKYYQQHPDVQKTLFDSLLAKSGRANMLPPHIRPLHSFKKINNCESK